MTGTGVLVDRDRPGIPGEVLRHVEPVTSDGLAGGETQIDRVAHSAPVGGGGIDATEGVDRDGAQRGLFAQPVVTRGETIEAGSAADAGVAGHAPRRDRTGEPEADVVGAIRVVETRLGEVEPDRPWNPGAQVYFTTSMAAGCSPSGST